MSCAPIVALLFLLSTLCFAMGLVDIFMDREEVIKTLGLEDPAKLYYVDNGTLNTYALRFRVAIEERIDTIGLSWRSRGQSPIHYSMSVTVSRSKVVEYPRFSVKNTGLIPRKTEKIVIPVRCTGKVAGEVNIDVHFNFTFPSKNNFTSMSVLRKKTCSTTHWLNDVPANNDQSQGENRKLSPPGEKTPGIQKADEPFMSNPNNRFYVIVGCVCGCIVVVAATVSIYFLRTKRSPAVKLPETSISAQRYMIAAASGANSLQSQPFLRPHTPSSNSKYSSVVSSSVVRSRYSPSVSIMTAERRELDIPSVLSDIQIDRNTVRIDQIILEGTYGEIALAKVRTKTPESETPNNSDGFAIMVKTTKEHSTEAQNYRFLTEALMFYGLAPHCNVLQVIGASVQLDSDKGNLQWDVNGPSPLLCYPHPLHGNLKKFLLRCRGAETGSSHALSTQNLVGLAVQIAQGMAYLHQSRVVHQDLATRNCWVDENLQLLIGDVGLSRDVFPGDYHCLGDNENRPVKWLSIEALVHRQFSSASDVWAFGVTLWELMTLAQQPYSDVDPFEMAEYLTKGYRLQQPYNCPDELFGILFCCCAQNPGSRPTFYQLFVALQDFHNQLQSFV